MPNPPDELKLGPAEPTPLDPNKTDGGAADTRAFSAPDLSAERITLADESSPFISAAQTGNSWVGRQIGHYQITGLLGSGAMGVVYRAHDTVIERQVAIKVLPEAAAGNQAVTSRFLAEAKATGRLNHPNVVQIYEVGQTSGTYYLVMELVEGGSIIGRFSADNPLSILDATKAVVDSAKGLAAAHAAGLLHRDIKPANLLVAGDGTVKVTDFGLAKFTVSAHAGATRAGQVLGTPYFMSPEQCEGRAVDVRSDVYSLGATYYNLLTGKNPYEESGSVVRVLYAHCHGQPLDPRTVRATVPEACAGIVLRATAKQPEDRYATVDEMLADLYTVIASLSGAQILLPSQSGIRSAASVSSIDNGGRKARTSRRAWLMGGATAAIVGGIGGWMALRGGKSASNSITKPTLAPAGPPIKIGVLHSLSGTMAESAAPVVDAILLAVEELNAAGGVLGRPIEAVVRDGESESSVFVREAEKLITADGVCTIFGCWTSAARRTVIPCIEHYNHLLIYSIQFEGLEDSPNVVYTGATPNQQIIPAVRWAFAFDRRRKFYLVGSDYVFPRAANAIIRDIVAELGGEVVGEAYRPLGDVEFALVVADIQRIKPDAIFNTINGDSNVAFFRELRRAGVTPTDIPTFSFSIGEAELRHLKIKDMEGDFAAWNYFQSIQSLENTKFVETFRRKFGPQRTVNDPMESSYLAVKLWAKAVEGCQSLEPPKIRAAMAGQEITAPEGAVRIDPATFHSRKTPRVGRILADGQFKIVWTGTDPELPEPYPPTRSKAKWNEFLAKLYDDWGNAWSASIK